MTRRFAAVCTVVTLLFAAGIALSVVVPIRLPFSSTPNDLVFQGGNVIWFNRYSSGCAVGEGIPVWILLFPCVAITAAAWVFGGATPRR